MNKESHKRHHIFHIVNLLQLKLGHVHKPMIWKCTKNGRHASKQSKMLEWPPWTKQEEVRLVPPIYVHLKVNVPYWWPVTEDNGIYPSRSSCCWKNSTALIPLCHRALLGLSLDSRCRFNFVSFIIALQHCEMTKSHTLPAHRWAFSELCGRHPVMFTEGPQMSLAFTKHGHKHGVRWARRP